MGIIGTGGMAHSHAQAFQRIKGVELTACCDISEGKAREFARKYQIRSVYTDHEKMLAKEKLDASSNVTPDTMHAPISIAVARRGIHILCEKPLATSVAEGKKMVAAVKRSGVINMVNFSYRSSSGLQNAARLVAAGAIGRLIHIEASYLQSWLVSKAWGDWRTHNPFTWRLSTANGNLGTLGDIGCHIYDAVTFLAGDISLLSGCRRCKSCEANEHIFLTRFTFLYFFNCGFESVYCYCS